jgi:hypothetical protein
VALFPGSAKLVLAWSLVGAGRKVLIAPTSSASTNDNYGLVRPCEVVELLTGIFVINKGSERNLKDKRLASAARHVRSQAMPATARFVLGVEAKMHKGIVA